ncbi:MAG: hypothetical protein AAB649_03365 [Patescibacteria group bacterium]|mgnify:CR=1 FL=1
MEKSVKNFVFWFLLSCAIFVPRLLIADDFFIQDEQPWIDRSQMYVNSLFAGEFSEAVRFPLSNHPAITLMTTVGPVMNFYGWYHSLDGTYEGWSMDHKRDAAVWARYIWGIVCSIALLFLYCAVARLRIFHDNKIAAALVVVLLGLEPWIWGISRTVSVDVLMAIGVVGMLVSAVVAFEQKSMKWVVVSGFWFAVAFVSKSPALITMPFAILLVRKRALVWVMSAYVGCILLWPPFLLHPIDRLLDVLGRAELHSTVQEVYLWPGFHPPLFIFVVSTFATLGCLLYMYNRIYNIAKNGWNFFALDIVFLAAIWHGAVLLYLHGDHARKNLPVLALLAFIGAIGWVWVLQKKRVSNSMMIMSLLVLQGIFVWPYFPHVISSYNVLFSSAEAKRLLVDVGNGSVLIADYINSHGSNEVYAIPMDSLVAPYMDNMKRGNIRGLPQGGSLENLEEVVTKIILPASLRARVSFDSDAKKLLEDLQYSKPEAVLSVRDVPMFYVYTYDHEAGI